jgi:hypothetical protein
MAFTDTVTYVYNRGQLWMGDAIAGGMPSSFPIDIAAIDTFEITLTPSYVEHVQKQTAVATKDIRALSEITATGKITCSQRSVTLMTRWLYGSNTTIAGGALSSTAFVKTPVVVGDILPIPGNRTKMTAVVVTDSTPTTGVLGTDYELDADAGLVKVLSISTLTTMPWKVAGTEGAATGINIFQSPPVLQGLRFKGINITNNNAIEILDIPKLQLSPAGAWQQLGDGTSVASYEWDFEILTDATNLVYPFGRQKL